MAMDKAIGRFEDGWVDGRADGVEGRGGGKCGAGGCHAKSSWPGRAGGGCGQIERGSCRQKFRTANRSTQSMTGGFAPGEHLATVIDMASDNQKLAAIFQQMADVMQILGHDGFRINAYLKIARVLDDLAIDVSTLGPDIARLQQLDGVGKGSAERIAEYLRSGRIQEHQDLLASVPPGLPALLDVPGLGPKTVAKLWKETGIAGIDDLKKKLQTDELAKVQGLGPKKIENLRKSLQFAQAATGRMLIGQAMPVARYFLDRLQHLPQVKQAACAGSLRRGRETIGDLDLLVAAEPGDAAAIVEQFVSAPGVRDVMAQGDTKASIRTAEGTQVDLRLVEPAQFGAALMYFTGSKEHNVALRQRAIDRGMKLSEYGLFRGDELVAAGTEDQVYKALELDWIPPELREDRGEIALAAEHRLPALVEQKDIHAELHAHTTASDGRLSPRDLALLAIDRGLHTLAITDHSASQVIANGLSARRLEEHIAAVRALAHEFRGRLQLLAGAEVDILAEGDLDYPNSLLRELDIVVASPHSALSQDPRRATRRLLRAINNPWVTILGHPTGRLILRREGLAPDMKEVIAAAAQRGIALEINANSHRLDLRDAHARAAIEAGVKLAINTDAHSPVDFDQLPYGVLTARRAGATVKDVVNCLTREDLARWIRSTRA